MRWDAGIGSYRMEMFTAGKQAVPGLQCRHGLPSIWYSFVCATLRRALLYSWHRCFAGE
jgi:hypothetical protein